MFKIIDWLDINLDFNFVFLLEISSCLTSKRRIISTTAGLKVISSRVSASSTTICRRLVPIKRRSIPKCSSKLINNMKKSTIK
jgi:hypothetical protein